jgi:hypothetical protein
MWLKGMDFALPAIILDQCTRLGGGFVALLAWSTVLYSYWKGKCNKIPIALYMFTIAVCANPVGSYFLDRIPYETQNKVVAGHQLLFTVWTAYLSVSFLFLILSLACLLNYYGPGKGVLAFGSIILILIFCVGFIVLAKLSGLPPAG